MATWQAQELVRGFRGLNLVGGDMVEVSPPWDSSSGLTAITGGTVAYEMLCLLAESRGFPVVEDWRDKRRCAAVI
jgi:arginase family enzyme